MSRVQKIQDVKTGEIYPRFSDRCKIVVKNGSTKLNSLVTL